MGDLAYSPDVVMDAQAQCLKAKLLGAHLERMRVEVLWTLAGSRAARRARSISGSSDANPALIIAAITGATFCDPCIARKSGLTEREVLAALVRLRETLRISTEFGRCHGCMRADLVSRLL